MADILGGQASGLSAPSLPFLTGQAPPPPVLRRDLDLVEGEPEADGSTVMLLHDPVQGRYFRLNPASADLLPYIDGRSAAEVADRCAAELGHAVSEKDVEGFFEFLRQHNLVRVDAIQKQRFAAQRGRSPTLFQKLLKSYIFFRIPLFRPDRFLTAALPHVSWLASRPMLVVHALAGLLGLFLATRQLDVFVNTLVGFLTVEGIIAYGVAVTLVKVFHECGHAFIAKAQGVRVPVIGVAFIVFWPVLYTDTSDAWRLKSRKGRLAIGAGGVAVELVIAAWSLLLWNLFPDGPIGGILFLFATTTWIISVLVNFNPLMRFDGYYLFADLVGEPNLEPRASALGRWKMREALFGFGEAPPERPRFGLILFAYAVWIYRFFLFLGIALLVYHLFFKLAGLVLFLVEIGYFILGPMVREVRVWWRKRSLFRLNGALLRLAVILSLGGLWLFLPWQGVVQGPGVLERPYHQLFAPSAALVTYLKADGDEVQQGDVVARLSSPALSHDLKQAELRERELAWEQAAIGVDDLRRDQALVIASTRASQRRVVAGKEEALSRLTITAPAAGRLVDLSPSVRKDGWVTTDERLIAVVEPDLRGTALVGETALARIDPGATAWFFTDDGSNPPIELTVYGIDTADVQAIDDPILLANLGGPIQTIEQKDGSQRPIEALYRVRLRPVAGQPAMDFAALGRFVIEARRETQFAKLRRRVLTLIYRESDF